MTAKDLDLELTAKTDLLNQRLQYRLNRPPEKTNIL